MVMSHVKFNIPSYNDRCNLVLALANSGYSVFVEEIKMKYTAPSEYLVVVKLKESMEVDE